MNNANNNIYIGNVYTFKCGAVNRKATIIGFDEETKKYQYATASGKMQSAEEDKILKDWTLIAEAEEKVLAKKAELVPMVETKRKNSITCLEAAIQTLVRRNVPMTAKELVRAMVADEAFFFSPKAKTPWNSVGTRLTTYMNNCEGDCRIKQIARGKFVHADYEPAENAE